MSLRQRKTAAGGGGTTIATELEGVASSPNSSCSGVCLMKLWRKLKRRSKSMLRAAAESRKQKSLFQCRYDPLSYSLNFDGGSCGTLSEDYYLRFYAFSSRFVAEQRQRVSPCKTLAAATH